MKGSRRFRNATLAYCLLVPVLAFSSGNLSFNRLNPVWETSVPETAFYGTFKAVYKPSERWIAEIRGQFAVEIIPWNTSRDETYWEPQTQYKLYCYDMVSGDYIPLAEKTLKHKGDKSGLTIKQTNRHIKITGAGGDIVFDDIADGIFPVKPAGKIILHAGKGSEFESVVEKFIPYPDYGHYDPATIDLSSTDVETGKTSAGYWRYLDRITPSDGSVALGGKYEVAVVPDDDIMGAYLIIYIDGDYENSDLWRAGDIKGRLIPTSFENHYDLEWYDSNRNRLDFEEGYGTFEGINLLTLDFPVLKSQIRFEKLLSNE